MMYDQQRPNGVGGGGGEADNGYTNKEDDDILPDTNIDRERTLTGAVDASSIRNTVA